MATHKSKTHQQKRKRNTTSGEIWKANRICYFCKKHRAEGRRFTKYICKNCWLDDVKK